MRTLAFLIALLFTGWALHAGADAGENRFDTQERELDALTGEAREQMNSLAEQALQIGLDALVHSEGGSVYPFALIADRNDDGQLIGYQGDPDNAPSADEWALVLRHHIQDLARENESLQLAVLVRLQQLETESGGQLPGLVAQVDHRDHRALMIFMPFVETEGGKRQPGQLMYQGSKERIFPETSD